MYGYDIGYDATFLKESLDNVEFTLYIILLSYTIIFSRNNSNNYVGNSLFAFSEKPF